MAKPAVIFSINEENCLEALLSGAVIVKFCDMRPSIFECQEIISSFWGLKGQFSMGMLTSCSLLIRFQLELDCSIALSHESRYMHSCQFHVYLWCSNLTPNNEVAMAPNTTSFPWFLDHCLFSALKAITSYLGHFLCPNFR